MCEILIYYPDSIQWNKILLMPPNLRRLIPGDFGQLEENEFWTGTDGQGTGGRKFRMDRFRVIAAPNVPVETAEPYIKPLTQTLDFGLETEREEILKVRRFNIDITKAVFDENGFLFIYNMGDFNKNLRDKVND